MEVRTFSLKDEPAVVALWQKCALVRPWNDPHLDIQRKMKVNPELFLVGVADGKIVAALMGGYEGHRGWINYLAVDPAVQRKGYGRQIMAEIEKQLLALGCPKISLHVRAGNDSALSLYDRIGYKNDNVISLGKRLIPDSAKQE
jgi:ribosomal protein S18 acetylase RimI-like enzyme